MEKFTTKLYEQLTRQLNEVAVQPMDEYERAMAGFHVSETAMMKLKEFISTYVFRDESEEINFFKNIKPKFHSELLYYVEIIHIEGHKPRGVGKEVLISFYHQISDRLNLYFSKQNLLYLYYRTKRSAEDQLLFLRKTDCTPLLAEDCVDLDAQFSTIASSNLARIMAFEKVLKYLEIVLDQMENGVKQLGEANKHHAVWTHSKVALIELAYAIHSTDAVNFGNANLKQVIQCLETAFNIDLGNFYRVFQNIRIRQTSRTAYIDELKEKLENSMDSTDMGIG